MPDESPGNGDTTDDRRTDPSGTDPGAGPRDGSASGDSSDEWGVADRPTVGDESDGGRDRIPIDLSGPGTGAADDAAEHAPEAGSTPIEPGDPDLENALFVMLGAIATVLVLVRLLGVPM
ncbi:hypothetical protein [Natrinema pallidum]|uniref:DUF7312 domain-containing protein n=2 Tax=Natrinema pallidum TaxID=69527 RepID=L9YGL9_9EURY|nr:hypothetical protein [Natrinema pallidum]ELY72692.1 hypothetical protein C487_18551 [Natrinema pallidum DSM 3751]QCW04487.1 hypothetical protein FGF80_15135 [Natrinema pallidum]